MPASAGRKSWNGFAGLEDSCVKRGLGKECRCLLKFKLFGELLGEWTQTHCGSTIALKQRPPGQGHNAECHR